MKIVLTDHPAVTRTLSQHLEPSWQVLTLPLDSFSWPTHELGIAVADAYAVTTICNPARQPELAVIQSALAEAQELIIATGPDARGEWLGWQVVTLLDVSPTVGVKRVWLTQLDATSIQAAWTQTRALNPALVAAHQAERAVDRLVDYTLSPLVSRLVDAPVRLTPALLSALALLTKVEATSTPNQPHVWSLHSTWASAQPNYHYYSTLTVMGDQDCTQLKDRHQLAACTAQLEMGEVYRVIKVVNRDQHQLPPPPPDTALALTALGGPELALPEKLSLLYGLYADGQLTYPLTTSHEVPPALWQAHRATLTGDYIDLPLRYDLPGDYLPDQVAVVPLAADDPLSVVTEDGLSRALRIAFRNSFDRPAELVDQTLTLQSAQGLKLTVRLRVLRDGQTTPPPIVQGQTLTLTDWEVSQPTRSTTRLRSVRQLMQALRRAVMPPTLVMLIPQLAKQGCITQHHERVALTPRGRQIYAIVQAYCGERFELAQAHQRFKQVLAIAHGQLDATTVVHLFWTDYQTSLQRLARQVLIMERLDAQPTAEACPHCGQPTMQLPDADQGLCHTCASQAGVVRQPLRLQAVGS